MAGPPSRNIHTLHISFFWVAKFPTYTILHHLLDTILCLPLATASPFSSLSCFSTCSHMPCVIFFHYPHLSPSHCLLVPYTSILYSSSRALFITICVPSRLKPHSLLIYSMHPLLMHYQALIGLSILSTSYVPTFKSFCLSFDILLQSLFLQPPTHSHSPSDMFIYANDSSFSSLSFFIHLCSSSVCSSTSNPSTHHYSPSSTTAMP